MGKRLLTLIMVVVALLAVSGAVVAAVTVLQG